MVQAAGGDGIAWLAETDPADRIAALAVSRKAGEILERRMANAIVLAFDGEG